MKTNKLLQFITALLLIGMLAALTIPMLVAPNAQAQSSYRAIPGPVLDTENSGVLLQVTNKLIQYNFTCLGGTNAPINVAGAEYAFVQVHQKYHPSVGTPATNTTYVCQLSGDGVNWINVQGFTVSGATTDSSYTEWYTNYNVGAAKWIRLYSVLTPAPGGLTNTTISIYTK